MGTWLPAFQPVLFLQASLYTGVNPEVMAAARPLLTGNPAADADIIKFYQARAALLKSQSASVQSQRSLNGRTP